MCTAQRQQATSNQTVVSTYLIGQPSEVAYTCIIHLPSKVVYTCIIRLPSTVVSVSYVHHQSYYICVP